MNKERKTSRSDISTLLTLLSADAKSAVLCVLRRVPSLTKVEVRNFPLLHFPRLICLIHGQLHVSAMCEKVCHIWMPMFLSPQYSTMVSFILSNTLSVTEIPPQKDSAKSQSLRLYFQFSITKILKALYTGLNIYSILEEHPNAILKMFFIDKLVNRLRITR